MTSSSSSSSTNTSSLPPASSVSPLRSQQSLGISLSLQNTSGPAANNSSVPPTQSQSQVPRRTRHRVDAGEPRGCFNNTNSLNSFYSGAGISQQYSNLPYPSSSSLIHSIDPKPTHHHSIHPNFLPRNQSPTTSSTTIAASSAAAASLALSSLISSSQENHPYRHPYSNLHSQLLLREMLQQQHGQSQSQSQIQSIYNNNNNNTIPKLPIMKFENNNNNNSIINNNSGEEGSSSGGELVCSDNLQVNKVKFSSSNLGCKKRKLYQPVRNGNENGINYTEKDEEISPSPPSKINPTANFHHSHQHHHQRQESVSPVKEISNNGIWGNDNNNKINTMNLIESLQENKQQQQQRKSPIHHPQNHHNHNHPRPNSSSPTPPRALMPPAPVLVSPSPQLTISQWKDQFKSTLMSSINDLVENQFSLLISAVSSPVHTQAIKSAPSPNEKLPQRKLPEVNRSSTPIANSIQPVQQQLNNSGPIIAPINMQRFPYHHRLLTPGANIPPYYPSTSMLNYNSDTDSPLSLVVTPKKKRHKVTDTRLTPRAVSRLLDTNNGLLGGSTTQGFDSPPPNTYFNGRLADSPPASLNEFVQSQIGAAGGDSEFGGGSDGGDSPRAGSFDGSGTGSYTTTNGGNGSFNNYGASSTLTPMHLRKAKLMFFWVRYPSSSVLKMYFPDIKFNKNNTAQLVKWFSNFREFYYIQMEKFARQALSEGVKCSDEIHISVDHELYRSLNMHYNRNNHIDVPSNFRYVVEQTLREFFKAIQTGKDSEQSWKKAIYKVIARMDDPVPEYFKSPNFLEKLE